jgi:hypothetical protein
MLPLYTYSFDRISAMNFLAKSRQTYEKVPVGQTALAALTQPSQRPLLTLIVAPTVAAFREKRAVPEEPVVDVGAPPHLCLGSAQYLIAGE